MMYDLIIIGAGPAGLSAAIYASRARLNTLVIEKMGYGGSQIINTESVDNYPGLPGIGGFDLAMKLREHAASMGAQFVEENVTAIGSEEASKYVSTGKGFYEARTLILATGARHRKLEVPGEEEYTGHGVSYCAVCDGAFYKDKDVAVVGGGNVALEDALYLSRLCRRVYLIHRRHELRGDRANQEMLLSQPNVTPVWDSTVKEIKGDNKVNSVTVTNVITGAESEIEVSGIFVAVGLMPNTEPFIGVVRDQGGFILTDEECRSSEEGIFAAGDIRVKSLRQVITAAADGAVAVNSAVEYLSRT